MVVVGYPNVFGYFSLLVYVVHIIELQGGEQETGVSIPFASLTSTSAVLLTQRSESSLRMIWYRSTSAATCNTQPISLLQLNVRKRAEKVRSATKTPSPSHLPSKPPLCLKSEASQHLTSPSSAPSCPHLTVPCTYTQHLSYNILCGYVRPLAVHAKRLKSEWVAMEG